MQKGCFGLGQGEVLKKVQAQQTSYLGVFVEVGSPGSVKGVGIGQWVLGVYGVREKEGVWGVRVPEVNSLKDRGVFGDQ